MKTLDRYVVKSFLISVLMCFLVLMSLRMVTDLFVNIDEFTKADQAKTFWEVMRNIATYYSVQSILYFRELGGVIVVLAAGFTLAWMNHTNELTAILASGVSLRRVLMPIVICAIAMNFLIVLDTELVIPPNKYRLIRDRDESAGKESFTVKVPTDQNGSCLFSSELHPAGEAGSQAWMYNPWLILRDAQGEFVGQVTSPKAVYDERRKEWTFLPGRLDEEDEKIHLPRVQMRACEQAAKTDFVPSMVGPEKILAEVRKEKANAGVDWRNATAIRGVKVHDSRNYMTIRAGRAVLTRLQDAEGRERIGIDVLQDVRFQFGADSDNKPAVEIVAAEARFVLARGGKPGHVGWVLTEGRLVAESDLDPEGLSLRESSNWVQYMSTREITELLRMKRAPDRRRAVLLRQTRFADFLNNVLLLLLVTPFILSRERNLKSSAGLAVLMGGGFFVFVYLTRNIAFQPVVAAWLPALIFGPIAVVMVDSVKT